MYPCKSTINDKCERFNHQRDMQCSYCNVSNPVAPSPEPYSRSVSLSIIPILIGRRKAMMGGPTDMFKETVFRALDSLERLERSLHEFKLDFHAGRLPWQQRRTLAIREA